MASKRKRQTGMGYNTGNVSGLRAPASRFGKAPSSVILNARSSRPTSILNGGKQTFGPLAYRGNAVDYTGGVKMPFRGARGGPKMG